VSELRWSCHCRSCDLRWYGQRKSRSCRRCKAPIVAVVSGYSSRGSVRELSYSYEPAPCAGATPEEESDECVT